MLLPFVYSFLLVSVGIDCFSIPKILNDYAWPVNYILLEQSFLISISVNDIYGYTEKLHLDVKQEEDYFKEPHFSFNQRQICRY